MAKYSRKAGQKVKRAIEEMKEGKLKSGRSGRKVKNRKQAIAIGLSEARERDAKVPPNPNAKKKGAKKKAARKKSVPKKKAAKKRAVPRKRSAPKKKTARKGS